MNTKASLILLLLALLPACWASLSGSGSELKLEESKHEHELGSRDSFLFLARLADACSRYDDMMASMRMVVQLSTGELSKEERDMFHVAHKHVLEARRSSWRRLKGIHTRMQKRPSFNNPAELQRVQEALLKVRGEIVVLCESLIALLDERIIPLCTCLEGKVYFLKMNGDYHRYIAEVSPADFQASIAITAKDIFEQATKLASKLPITNNTRLGLALNYSVFCHEILREPAMAIEMAQSAFDEAILELNNPDEGDDWVETTRIIQVIAANLHHWNELEIISNLAHKID